jgi:hypothetical protein
MIPARRTDVVMPTVSAPAAPRALRRLRLDSSAIERALVRSSVGALAKGRDTCRHCHRTPLVGEVVHLYARGRRAGEELVCELCRPLRAAEPDRSVLVRSPEQRGSVRPVALRP